jgi:hypothetical protein
MVPVATVDGESGTDVVFEGGGDLNLSAVFLRSRALIRSLTGNVTT